MRRYCEVCANCSSAYHSSTRYPNSQLPLESSAARVHVQVSGVSGDLVPEPLGCNDGNLIANPLVGLEVQRQLGVVTLNDDLGGLLDGLGSDATHFGDLYCELGKEAVVGRGGGCRVSELSLEENGEDGSIFRVMCVMACAVC